MLQVIDLGKSFDGFKAVDGANLQVAPGEVVAVIGPNGAGKTTLFHLITGQLKPDSGRIVFKGEDIAGLPPHRVCRRGIGRSYQVVNVFDRLSVFENVQISVLAQCRQTWNMFQSASGFCMEKTKEILASVGLEDKADNICGTLSHGDRKVLEIAIALGSRPELLILDEPTAGMSPEETATALELMKNLSRQLGLTLLFCEHDMEMVFAIADRIMVMQQGHTIIQDTPEKVRLDPQVREAYLGGAEVCSR